MKRTIVAILILTLSTLATADLSPDRFDRLLGDYWYGIYMQEAKVGYAQIALEKAGPLTWHFSTSMVIKLSTGQTDVTLEQNEFRVYTGEQAYLTANKFSTSGDMGSIIVTGKRDGDNYAIEIDIMGNKQSKTLGYPLETFEECVKAQLKTLTGDLKTGDKIEQTVFVFDPSILDTMVHEITLTGKKEYQLAGIPTEVYTFIDSIPKLNLGGTHAIDINGSYIYQEFPSMGMIMKLETKEAARDITASFDILEANIIKSKNGPNNPRKVTEARYQLIGINIADFPNNNRMNIESANGDTVNIKVESISEEEIKALPEKLSNLPANMADFLQSEPLIQTDAAEIKSLAAELKGDNSPGYTLAKIINRWVFENINKRFSADMSNAVQTLKLKRGDCGEHAALTVALLRAAGIPARTAAGLAYVPSMNGFGYHAWVEVYVGEWIQMDPTWGEDIADATHIMLSTGSMYDQIPAILGSVNKLKVNILEYK